MIRPDPPAAAPARSAPDTELGAVTAAQPSLGATLATLREARDGAERAWLVAREVRMFSRREVGRGTTVTVSLQAMPRGNGAASPVPTRARRVVVIDDDPLVAEAVRQALAAENHVAVATSGGVALAQIAGGAAFEVNLCDLMMPEMDGRRFYDEVAQVAGAVTPAITFLSAGVEDTATQGFLTRSGCTVLEKPFDPQGLREYVRGRVRGATA